MIASKDGHIMDDFLLQKPLNWRPDPQGRAAAISSFTPHPPSSWLDTIGISFGILNPVSAFEMHPVQLARRHVQTRWAKLHLQA